MLQIPLTPQTEATLRQRAEAEGEDVEVYAARLLQEALTAPNVEAMLAPFRSEVEASGATDAELDALGEALREEVWQARDGVQRTRLSQSIS